MGEHGGKDVFAQIPGMVSRKMRSTDHGEPTGYREDGGVPRSRGLDSGRRQYATPSSTVDRMRIP